MTNEPKQGCDISTFGRPTETLPSQALIVAAGPFTGRICLNDDDDFVLKSDFADWELAWMEEAGVVWRELTAEESDIADDQSDARESVIGVDCEVVTFGFYLYSRGYYIIPRQFLRPATMNDLVERHSEISNTLLWEGRADDADYAELADLLKEKDYILSEIHNRERFMRNSMTPRNVFLCHASADKPFVRRVFADLSDSGFSPWLDEFEIKVGDSIVEKINDAMQDVGSIILFVSKESMRSDWVRREWSSTLARKLKNKNVRILPVLVEDCDMPSIIADIKYADFRRSYQSGLEELVNSLG